MPRKTTIQKFTVEGSGQFPIDMLRYDACWPAASDDAAKIAAQPGDDLWHERRKVTLRSHNGDVTEGRWNSFTWRVVETRTDPY